MDESESDSGMRHWVSPFCMASLSPRQRIQSFVQRITTPTVNSHPLIPLSEGEKAALQSERFKMILIRIKINRICQWMSLNQIQVCGIGNEVC
jgi:hypothetical protein